MGKKARQMCRNRKKDARQITFPLKDGLSLACRSSAFELASGGDDGESQLFSWLFLVARLLHSVAVFEVDVLGKLKW